MVSLWGRNNDNGGREEQQDHEEDEQPVTRHQQEADERTRLLPRDNQAYLSPDDPAVSTSPLFNEYLADSLHRSPRITSGAFELYEDSQPYFSPSASSGGRSSSCLSSSIHQCCIRVAPASSRLPIPH